LPYPGCCNALVSQVTNATCASQIALLDLFERIEDVFRRLETYINIPMTAGMTEVIVKVMAEVLCILAITTKEINENSTSEFRSGHGLTLLGLLIRQKLF
jgi:hypothetical protein